MDAGDFGRPAPNRNFGLVPAAPAALHGARMSDDSKTIYSFIKALLAVVILLAVIFAALIGWVGWQKSRYHRLTDTHDLAKRIDDMGAGYLARRGKAALVIAVLQKGETHVAGFGKVGDVDGALPDEHTLFEIGSVTKVFTALAAGTQVAAGKLKWDDSVKQHLPADLGLAEGFGRITLRHLATHSSGLPRLPGNLDLAPERMANPYATYGTNELNAFLRGFQPKVAPGRSSEYSNLGMALLGHIVALQSGRSLAGVIQTEVTAPLGLTNTLMRLPDDWKSRLAPGHTPEGNPAPGWDFDFFAGAGALKSCAADLLQFLRAQLAPETTPLQTALEESQQLHFKSWQQDHGLGWMRTTTVQGELDLLWHNGGTGGYVSFVGFDRKHRTGVVVLSNYGDAMKGDNTTDNLGFDLLMLASKISLR